MRSFAAKTPGGLPDYSVCLPVIRIQIMSKIFQRLNLDFFTVRL